MSMIGDSAVKGQLKRLKKLIETLDSAGCTLEEKLEKINKWIDETIEAAEDGWL